MDWAQVLALFFANAGLIIWFRAESRADWRHMDNKVDAIRELVSAIQQEMKDFHNRLVKIEQDRIK